MKGSHQNPLSCLSQWPYYLPPWIRVLTPLAASSLNFLFFCSQAFHNPYPSQAGSLSFYPPPISFCSDSAAARTLLSPSHPALSLWPRLQVPRLCCCWLYPFIRSLAAFLHRQRKKDFFFIRVSSHALTEGTSRACPGHLVHHSFAAAWQLLVVKVRWELWGGESLFFCTLRSLRGTQA